LVELQSKELEQLNAQNMGEFTNTFNEHGNSKRAAKWVHVPT